jgi:hypothetical protein
MRNEIAVNVILEKIEKISEIVRSSEKFSESVITSSLEYTKEIAKFIKGTEKNAFWFSVLITISLNRHEFGLVEIASFLKSSIITVFQNLPLFDELVNLKLIRKGTSQRHRRQSDRYDSINYYIPSSVIRSIATGEAIKPKRVKKDVNIYQLLDSFTNLIEELHHESLSNDEYFEEVNLLLKENQKLPILKAIKRFKLNNTDTQILLYTCSEFVDTCEAELLIFLKIIFSESSTRLRIRKLFMEGKNALQMLNLVTTPSGAFKTEKIILTDVAKELFFGSDVELFASKEKRMPDIILASEIISKKLFFNKTEEESLNQLTELLKPDNFISICNRMNDLGLRTGFNILLYGPAGTGKTESCLQLAKNSGRDLYKVAIEGTKNMYFGESEKLIKGIFDRYSKLISSSAVEPILYLNECDGILSRRIEISSSVAQTQNAMQNLLLEGLESIKQGIVLATTNLTQNLDPAFQRRFTFKIEIMQPDTQVKNLIWKAKISGLENADYQWLAENFDFSGGQIENITRKVVLNQVLYGGTPSIKQIIKMAQNEIMVKNVERTRIGFVR